MPLDTMMTEGFPVAEQAVANGLDDIDGLVATYEQRIFRFHLA